MKKYPIILITFLFVSLSSCLEITEQVRLRENGSGQFTFTVDMSEAEPLLNMVKGFSAEADPEQVSTDLETGMEGAYQRLQSVKGVHQPTLIRSDNGLLSGITFEYDNIEALNNAINVVHNNKPELKEAYFAWDGKQLHRLNTLKIENEIKEKTGNDLNGLDLTVNGKSIKEMMGSMVYRTEYTFDKPIRSISNSNATLSADKRKVTLERYLLDDTRKANSLENIIKL
ncbi:hypothetical protein D770_18800 [Flammeovirgaceae bacterium 311]|nr:hypothetical protein D770_18800 [Flammeovirgaceae bacterium 311]